MVIIIVILLNIYKKQRNKENIRRGIKQRIRQGKIIANKNIDNNFKMYL